MANNYQQKVGAYLLDPDDLTGQSYMGSQDNKLIVSNGIGSGDIAAPAFMHLSTDGSLQTGTDDANGDYSSVNGYFYIEAPRPLRLMRMLVHIEDTTGAASADYGNITSGLTNGIAVKVWDSDGTGPSDATVLNTLTVDDPIKTNAEWGKMCYDVTYENVGNGNDYINVRWTFRNTGTYIRLDTGQRFGVELSDNLSGLITHHFIVQGHFEQTTAAYT